MQRRQKESDGEMGIYSYLSLQFEANEGLVS